MDSAVEEGEIGAYHGHPLERRFAGTIGINCLDKCQSTPYTSGLFGESRADVTTHVCTSPTRIWWEGSPMDRGAFRDDVSEGFYVSRDNNKEVDNLSKLIDSGEVMLQSLGRRAFLTTTRPDLANDQYTVLRQQVGPDEVVIAPFCPRIEEGLGHSRKSLPPACGTYCYAVIRPEDRPGVAGKLIELLEENYVRTRAERDSPFAIRRPRAPAAPPAPSRACARPRRCGPRWRGCRPRRGE